MSNSVEIRVGSACDVAGWLELAREVEPLFGPMADVPEFREALAGAVEQGHAVSALANAVSSGSPVVGGVVVSPDTNSIEWLAVSQSARGQGAGKKLLQAALALLDPNRPILVQTFAPSCAEGLPARSLYLQFGFKDGDPMGPNPAGIPTVMMRRPPLPESQQA